MNDSSDLVVPDEILNEAEPVEVADATLVVETAEPSGAPSWSDLRTEPVETEQLVTASTDEAVSEVLDEVGAASVEDVLTYESMASWADVRMARGEYDGEAVEAVKPKAKTEAPKQPALVAVATPHAPHGRPVRHRRRVAALAALSTAFVGLGISQVWAAPDKVLQDVQVRLSGDGSVKDIKNVVIRRSSDDDTSSDESSLDPARWGSHLPVRIQTTYQLGDSAGTNLEDIEGKSGVAVIEVTVQNLTAKPTELTSGSTQMALVGTPMTVVASAKLGKSGLSRVITKRPVAGPVTNGSLGSSDGKDVVQWAALLVPPKLSPSATFRLVLSGKDLKVPAFNISVQPRLLADSSMSEVLTSAFDPQSKSSSVALQIATVREIGNVNKALDDATEGLGEIQTQLNDSANTLGRQTYQDLLTGTKNLTTQMKDVGTQLDDTQSGLTEGLDATQSTLDRALDDSSSAMQTALGDPTAGDRGLVSKNLSGDCVKTQTWSYSGKAKLSVYQHIRLAEKNLEELTTAGGTCAAQIRDELEASIGDAGVDCSTATDPSALCAIEKAKDVLDATVTQIRGARDTALLDDSPIAQLKHDLEELRDSTDELDDDAGEITGSNQGDIAQLNDELEDLADLVNSLKAQVVGVNLDGVFDAIDAIKSAAQAPDLDLIGELIDKFCDKSGESVVQDIASAINLDLGDCSGALEDELDNATQALGDIEELADDAPDRPAVVGGLDDLADRLDTVQTQIGDAQAALDAGSGGLASAVGELADELEQVLEKAQDVASSIDDVDDEAGRLRGKVNTAFNALDGIQDAYDHNDEAEQILGAAKQQADDHLSDLVAGLDTVQAKNAATRSATDKAITASKKQLTEASNGLKGSLNEGVQQSVDSINTGLSESSKDVDDTRQQLLDDLNAVLAGIGSPNSKGTGLIGVLLQNAGVTEDQATSLDGANAAAKKFSNVQAANREQALLEWRQLEQALAEQNNFQPFAVDAAPANSLSVFSFQLGQE